MRRVTLLLEVLDDEAEQVIAAISGTGVRFGGMLLSDLLAAGMAGAPTGMPDAAIGHHAASDGILYAGGPRYSVAKLMYDQA